MLQRVFRRERIDQLCLFDVFTKAIDRQQYLLHPELGRQLRLQDRELLLKQCPPRPRLQIVLGDGLSATALVQQGPPLLDSLWEMAGKQKLALGRPFLVHQARVGILNEI
ncbi:MAG: ethanolamine ammonia-lyase light chain EutC, partial [Planctomycetia bacterium]